MAQITLTIPDDRVNEVLTAIKGVHPIPQIVNPENENEIINEFTDVQWTKKLLIGYIKNTIYRYERKKARDAVVIDNINIT